MVWTICVAGTIVSEEITAPAGKSGLIQGGSAVYSSLAAASHAPVWLHGIVGNDRADVVRQLCADVRINLDGLAVTDVATSRWAFTHHRDGSTTYEHIEEGANATWTGQIGVAARGAEVLFLASMRPALQERVLEQCRPRLVGIDTMTMFVDRDANRVRSLIRALDLLFVTREELTSLTGVDTEHWSDSALSLIGDGRLRAVIVKSGRLGAALVTASGVVNRRARHVRTVIDPTGAGDALAGGFLGACAEAERDDDAFLVKALESGLNAAALAIGSFGPDGLRALPRPR